MSVQTAGAAKPGRGSRALIDFKKNWQYLLLCLPSMIGYVFFHFVPLAGIIMPFTKSPTATAYSAASGCGSRTSRRCFTRRCSGG